MYDNKNDNFSTNSRIKDEEALNKFIFEEL